LVNISLFRYFVSVKQPVGIRKPAFSSTLRLNLLNTDGWFQCLFLCSPCCIVNTQRKHVGRIMDVNRTLRCTVRRLYTVSTEFLVVGYEESIAWLNRLSKLTSIAIVIGWEAVERWGVQCCRGASSRHVVVILTSYTCCCCCCRC